MNEAVDSLLRTLQSVVQTLESLLEQWAAEREPNFYVCLRNCQKNDNGFERIFVAFLDDEDTDLHVAIRNGWFEEARSLIKRSPRMVHTKNAKGEYPLHAACAFDAPRDIVRELARLFPYAIRAMDHEGYVPWDLADTYDKDGWMETMFREILMDTKHDPNSTTINNGKSKNKNKARGVPAQRDGDYDDSKHDDEEKSAIATGAFANWFGALWCINACHDDEDKHVTTTGACANWTRKGSAQFGIIYFVLALVFAMHTLGTTHLEKSGHRGE